MRRAYRVLAQLTMMPPDDGTEIESSPRQIRSTKEMTSFDREHPVTIAIELRGNAMWKIER